MLVAGSTGGVGQLVVAKLLEARGGGCWGVGRGAHPRSLAVTVPAFTCRAPQPLHPTPVSPNPTQRGYKVRALTRSTEKAAAMFGPPPSGGFLEFVQGDTRTPSSLAAATAGVDAVACCTGTTAFPSARWKGGNGPRETDAVGVANLVRATPPSVRRFVLVSSAGVERSGRIPYSILNLFGEGWWCVGAWARRLGWCGTPLPSALTPPTRPQTLPPQPHLGVLTSKAEGEAALVASRLPATTLRPGRLIDGPYTSYDLNTLLRATTGPDRAGVRVARGDVLDGQTSRLAVAGGWWPG